MLAIWLREVLGIDLVVVPYNGGNEARAALVGGHVDATVADIPTIINEGFRALALDSDEETDLIENLPFWGRNCRKNTTSIYQTNLYGILPRTGGPFGAEGNYPERWNIFVMRIKRF